MPYVAGGSTDVTMRALASATEKHLGRPIIIENRAGADGTLAPAQMAATAKPDGYTVAQFPSSVILAHFLRKTTYDPTKDFTYVIGVTGYTYGVVVRSDAPWRTFQDFLSNAKANPDKVNYATTGAATNPYATMELIAKQHGIKWVSVAFKGNGEQANALLGGHIHAIASSTGWGPQVNAGQFRLLVTWGASRTKSWPTVPTLRETGIDMVADEPYGIAGPKGMDPSVIKVLHDAFKKGMQEPSFLAMLDKLDQEVVYMSSDDYRDFAMKKIAETKRVVEELGLKEE